jgi:hypothetical protein
MEWDGVERRRFPRAEFPCKVIIGSPIRLLASHTENIGEGGIRVILEERLHPFTKVSLELFFEREKPIRCKGRVVWIVEKVNPIENEPLLFDTGIEFVEINETDKEYIRRLVETIISGKNKKR